MFSQLIWKGKNPPENVWDGDVWVNEIDNKVYKADNERRVWVGDIDIPYSKKTKIYGKRKEN